MFFILRCLFMLLFGDRKKNKPNDDDIDDFLDECEDLEE